MSRNAIFFSENVVENKIGNGRHNGQSPRSMFDPDIFEASEDDKQNLKLCVHFSEIPSTKNKDLPKAFA
jgi:hypothetical protein